MEDSNLIPVFKGNLNGHETQLCDARTLHSFMRVRRDFSNWIKSRIRKFSFMDGEDFTTISRSPELANGNRGASIDYHLTLDMAKELAMVENNEQGRAARRYFIECERRALAAVTAAAAPTIDYARISSVQKQDLHEIVQAIVAAGVQTYGETWARFHRKFRINKYEELPASQYEQARGYLIAKLPSGYAGQEVHDAATFDLTDTQRLELAFSTSAEAGANVQRTVFQAMMSGKNADWRRARYLLTLGYDRDGQATLPYAKVLTDGQLVASLPELTQYIAKADIMPSDTQLTALASACMQRLSERAQVREGRTSRYPTTLNEATIARA